MRVLVAFIVSASVLTPAFAAESGANETGLVKEKKICRTSEVDTGTRLGQRKVCKTEAEWAEQERRSDQTLRNLSKGMK